MPPNITGQKALAEYQEIIYEIERETLRLQKQIGGFPCPESCYDCCYNTATMRISEIEAQDLKIGLQKLPKEIQSHILEKASKSITKLNTVGFTEKNFPETSGTNIIEALKGTSEGECPMLVGGVCSVYKHRPIICRVWGYPITNNNQIGCCWKTFIGKRKEYKPIQYDQYWEKCRDLSEENESNPRGVPNCYLVKRLLS